MADSLFHPQQHYIVLSWYLLLQNNKYVKDKCVDKSTEDLMQA